MFVWMHASMCVCVHLSVSECIYECVYVCACACAHHRCMLLFSFSDAMGSLTLS